MVKEAEEPPPLPNVLTGMPVAPFVSYLMDVSGKGRRRSGSVTLWGARGLTAKGMGSREETTRVLAMGWARMMLALTTDPPLPSPTTDGAAAAAVIPSAAPTPPPPPVANPPAPQRRRLMETIDGVIMEAAVAQLA